jgi:DNA polymerase-3 subunit delta'
MTEGSHLNLTVLESEGGYIKIDRVRELQRALSLKIGAGYKVAVVDDADQMMPASQNALLKTLEEPPLGSVIILVTSRPALLLPTIISRVRRISFRPLGVNVIASALEAEGVAPGEAKLVASLSLGSLAAARESLSESAYEERMTKARSVLALPGGDVEGALALAGKLSKDDDLNMTLEYLKLLIRDAAVISADGASVAVDPEHALAGSFERHSLKALTHLYDAVEETQTGIRPPANANKQLSMEALLLELGR